MTSPQSVSQEITQSLPIGTRLEEFLIEQVLGIGGFGITYLARDSSLGRRVVIKENLPSQFCWRDSHALTVRPRHTQGEDADNFQYSLQSFRKEAATLASLDHPGIVKVLRSFEANGTAYFVMPFVEGTALDEVLRQRASQNSPFTEAEIQDLLSKMLDALGYLHERGIYHRDIKPGNILITQSGPVLIDFGAARQRLSERSLTVIESAGYTPFEQLQSRGKIGPWSDIYALGATLYKVITGQTVARANDRVMDDPHVPLTNTLSGESRYSKSLLASIDKAVAPSIGARFQTVAEWRGAIAGRMEVLPERLLEESAPAQPVELTAEQGEELRKSQKRRKQWMEKITAMVVALVTGVTGGVVVALVRGPSTSYEGPALQEKSSQSSVGNASPPAPVIPSTQVPDGTSANPGQQTPEAAQATKELPFVNTLGMKFVPVPGTEVLMCVHETRNADYAAYAAAHSGVNSEWRKKVESGKEQHPVVNVSYEDAEEFCRWLSAKEGATYRLPSDAEWSRAVGLPNEQGKTPAEKDQNGPGDVFPWGSYFPAKPRDGNYSPSVVDDGYQQTAPVMGFRANELGIYDLGGNVWEWCQDWYDVSPEYRVRRGASWLSSDRVDLRSSYRYYGPPMSRVDNYGFRCVLVMAVSSGTTVPMVPSAPPSSLAPTTNGDPLAGVSKDKPYQNSLGMAFVPAGTPGVLFSVWETRVKDFEAFVEESGHDAVSENTYGGPAYTLESGVEWKQAGGSWRDPRFPAKQSGEHPVVCVSYLDAEAFCAWLTNKERASGEIPATASYRLPSDSEWSRACGGSEYPWGETYPPKSGDGNYLGAEGMVGALAEGSNELSQAGFRDGAPRTSAVGMFKENRFGLYDMGGNVFEWCSTWYTADLNDEETKKELPALKDDAGGQAYRVLRGASWLSNDRVRLPSSYRYYAHPTSRHVSDGFRCVLMMAGG